MQKLLCTAAVTLSIILQSVAFADTFDQYVPYTQKRAAQFWGWNKATNSFIAAWSQTATMPTSSHGGNVEWGDPNNWGARHSAEEWETRYGCSGGTNWVFLNGYHDVNDSGHYPIRTIKALYQDVNSGQSFDISTACLTQDGQPHGQPYAVYNVYGSPYIVKVWMQIWTNGHPDKLVYWEHKITPYQSVKNPCWQSDTQTTRTVINQQESWWEQSPGAIPAGVPPNQGQWIIGGGSAPFDANGTPIDPTPWDGTQNNFGYGVGAAWTRTTYSQPGLESSFGCLRYSWTW